MTRICSQGLIRGWTAWQEQWETAARQKRMLAAAAARLARPALAAAVAHWRGEWEGAVQQEEEFKRSAVSGAST